MDKIVYYWIVFAAYIIFLAISGIRAKKKTNTLEDFMVAGRNIGPVLLALSFGVTYFSAVLIIGGGENAYNWGLSTLYIALINVFIGVFCMFVFFGRRTRIMADEFGSMTISQFLAKRYDSKGIQYFSSIVILLFETVYLVSIYLGLSILLEIIMPNTPNAYIIAVVIVGIISIFYLSISGSHGAITTDVAESIIMVTGVVCLAVIGLIALGGFSGLEATLEQIEIAENIGEGGLTSFPGEGGFALIGFILVTSFGTWGMPQMTSRFFTAKRDKKTLKWGLVISVVWSLIISFLAYLNGAIGRAYFFINPTEGVTAANIVPSLTVEILPVAFASIFIAAVTAASLTTGEKVILMASGAFSVDFYQSVTNASDEKTMKVTRLTTIFVVIVAVILAIIKPDSVLALAMFAWSAIASTILMPYVFGLFWKKGTAKGAIAAGATALFLTVFWWLAFRSVKLNVSLNTTIFPLLGHFGELELLSTETITITLGSIHEFIVSQVAALIVFVIVSLCTKKPANDKIEELFKKINRK